MRILGMLGAKVAGKPNTIAVVRRRMGCGGKGKRRPSALREKGGQSVIKRSWYLPRRRDSRLVPAHSIYAAAMWTLAASHLHSWRGLTLSAWGVRTTCRSV